MKFSDIELPSNHKFGFFFTSVFAVAGFYFNHLNAINVSYAFFTLAALFLSVTIVKARLLLPLNKLWMYFGLLLGMIISPIVLGIIFFGMLTPISFLMKLFKRDELKIKLVSSKSYWKNRDSSEPSTASFKNQF